MAITAAQMNDNIEIWNQQIAALRANFDAARESATITRDVIVDDGTIGKALLQFQQTLVKGVNLVETIKQRVTAFKEGASPEQLATTVNKAKDAWARAILVVVIGHEDALAAQNLYTKDDINLADVSHLYRDYSALFHPEVA